MFWCMGDPNSNFNFLLSGYLVVPIIFINPTVSIEIPLLIYMNFLYLLTSLITDYLICFIDLSLLGLRLYYETLLHFIVL